MLCPTRLDLIPYSMFRKNHFTTSTWFIDYSTPAHFPIAMSSHFHVLESRIGSAGTVSSPPRFPDLNRLDLFLWRYLKSLSFDTPVEILQDLKIMLTPPCRSVWRNLNGSS
ncbi:hypothetical protein AVEN_249515-1 [Araneus ventricosus]|uniref:Uncharacterized protein n=1 Tax=Araneus ventricosus TaxID=182803 RepID=A0A4Y2HN37_ARAVE|nr:hypothetical protein AVEN_249515-1 [Araneus ventricosus]